MSCAGRGRHNAAIRKLEVIHVRDALRERGVVVDDIALSAMEAYVLGTGDESAWVDLLESLERKVEVH